MLKFLLPAILMAAAAPAMAVPMSFDFTVTLDRSDANLAGQKVFQVGDKFSGVVTFDIAQVEAIEGAGTIQYEARNGCLRKYVGGECQADQDANQTPFISQFQITTPLGVYDMPVAGTPDKQVHNQLYGSEYGNSVFTGITQQLAYPNASWVNSFSRVFFNVQGTPLGAFDERLSSYSTGRFYFSDSTALIDANQPNLYQQGRGYFGTGSFYTEGSLDSLVLRKPPVDAELPEPGSLALIGLGVVLAASRAKRRTRRA